MRAINSTGYQVEQLTRDGWKPCSPIYRTKAEAESQFNMYAFHDGEYRVYEALAPAAT